MHSGRSRERFLPFSFIAIGELSVPSEGHMQISHILMTFLSLEHGSPQKQYVSEGEIFADLGYLK
jgi:hypothetical protein